MKIFKVLSKFYKHLTKQKNHVEYEELPKQESEEPFYNEEETMESVIEDVAVSQVRDWAMNKIQLLHEADRHRNAKALAAEFDEWINIPEGTEELDYLCLESDDWTDEQEIDVR
jgi:hypothetical protein